MLIEDDLSGMNETDNLSVSALNRTEDMELNKTDVIAKMAFPSQLDAESSHHVIADNFDDNITIDLQSK